MSIALHLLLESPLAVVVRFPERVQSLWNLCGKATGVYPEKDEWTTGLCSDLRKPTDESTLTIMQHLYDRHELEQWYPTSLTQRAMINACLQYRARDYLHRM